MSNVDPTFPPDGQIAQKATFRLQFGTIKTELEANEATFAGLLTFGDSLLVDNTNLTYNRATHGDIVSIIFENLTANRTLTLPAENGRAGGTIFLRCRNSPGFQVTILIEDRDNLGTYFEQSCANDFVRIFRKDANSEPGVPEFWTHFGQHENGARIPSTWADQRPVITTVDATGDRLIIRDASDGNLYKLVAPEHLPSGGGGDTAPTQVPSTATPFSLTDARRVHLNVEIISHADNVDFEVPAAAGVGSKWYIRPQHNGCIVSVAGDAGSVNGTASGTARLVNGGAALVEVHDNPGSAPVVLVRGDVVLPATATGAKTYAADDHGRDWRVTSGQQDMPAAATLPEGWFVNLFREVAGDITVAGVDASHTLPGPGAVTVSRMGTALIAVGSGGATILDAA